MASSQRPLVVATNDDGFHARGLNALVHALSASCDVVTVAPATEQSAMSHAITLHRPLRLHTRASGAHSLDGTPVDCVYVALHHPGLLARRPDLVVSGINHGLNLGADVLYSGTVAGAREGALRDIPSVAFSAPADSDFVRLAAECAELVTKLLTWRAAHPSESAPLLNVNFPSGTARGVRATTLGQRVYEDLVDVRADPRGRHYLWIGGPSVSHPPMPGTDTEAFEQGFVSVTPLSIDSLCADHLPIARALTG